MLTICLTISKIELSVYFFVKSALSFKPTKTMFIQRSYLQLLPKNTKYTILVFTTLSTTIYKIKCLTTK